MLRSASFLLLLGLGACTPGATPLDAAVGTDAFVVIADAGRDAPVAIDGGLDASSIDAFASADADDHDVGTDAGSDGGSDGGNDAGSDGGTDACVPDAAACPSNQCGGTASDGCGGTITCNASCDLTGYCACAGGHCGGNYCVCNGGPCL